MRTLTLFTPRPAKLLTACLLLLFMGLSGVQAEGRTNEDPVPELVSIDFDNVDIGVFIKFISNLTGKNFVVDPAVRGKVTVISPTQISVGDAYKVFESVLEINGFSTVESGRVVKIIPIPKAKSDNLDTRVSAGPAPPGNTNDVIVTRIIPLVYAGADELKKLFSPLLPKGSVILAYGETNMLIVTATLSSIDRLLKIIEVIDVQSIGKKISVLTVHHADAKKLVQNLSVVFTAKAKSAKKKTGPDPAVKFVADERTNSVIILASRRQTGQIRELITLLDRKVPRGEEKIRVYYLEHASAENIVKVIQSIPTKKGGKTEPGQAKAPLLSENIMITADKATNSIIIMADKEDYPVLEDVIAKLDIPRAMVYIECLIMEVNVTRGLDIGTEWRTSQSFRSDDTALVTGFGGTGDSGYTNLSGIGSEGALPKGFSVGVVGKNINIGGIAFPDIQAVIQAFQSDKDVHILATPQILTTENEEASIHVGKNVPYQTRSAAESGSTTYNSFEYKDVGITLKITPQISKDRLVRLDVSQLVTKLDTVNQSSPDRPTTLKREIDTTIIVEDGSSVIIGGLIDESLTKTRTQTPCLGGMPGVGWAFKSESKGGERTNLYVLLTPKVVKNPLEVQEIFQQKKEEMDRIRSGEIDLYRGFEPMGDDKSSAAEEESSAVKEHRDD